MATQTGRSILTRTTSVSSTGWKRQRWRSRPKPTKWARRKAIRADAYAREQVDAAFPSPVCDTVFGKAYCVSLTPSGSLQIISFLEAVSRQIRREMDAATAAAQKRQAKYLDKYSGGQRRKKRRS